MLRIVKGSPPDCLRVLRATPGSTWISVYEDQKSELRAALLNEQGWICAYCMRRIRGARDASGKPDMTVEHWSARSGGGDPFHWPDLLGVCLGGAGSRERHCDHARGDRTLTLHPARDEVVDALKFLPDGRVVAREAAGKKVNPAHVNDLQTLNLNAARLRSGRLQVYDTVVSKAQAADLTQLRAMLQHWEERDAEGQFGEYAGVARQILRDALTRRSSRARRTRKSREQ